ncbi:hypothetical protein C7475_1011090 [Chitinophaga sp. S165]|nr:hypothetical protein C7475_1011090 [Chitinophaga sp. S165]
MIYTVIGDAYSHMWGYAKTYFILNFASSDNEKQKVQL